MTEVARRLGEAQKNGHSTALDWQLDSKGGQSCFSQGDSTRMSEVIGNYLTAEACCTERAIDLITFQEDSDWR